LRRAEQIADHVGGEAALPADRELVERDVFRRLLDAALERWDGLSGSETPDLPQWRFASLR
jgi:hypothetical protein